MRNLHPSFEGHPIQLAVAVLFPFSLSFICKSLFRLFYSNNFWNLIYITEAHTYTNTTCIHTHIYTYMHALALVNALGALECVNCHLFFCWFTHICVFVHSYCRRFVYHSTVLQLFSFLCLLCCFIFVVLSPFLTSSYHLFTSCQAAVALSFVGCRFYYDRSFVCLSTFVFACVCLLVCLAFSLLKYLQIS